MIGHIDEPACVRTGSHLTKIVFCCCNDDGRFTVDAVPSDGERFVWMDGVVRKYCCNSIEWTKSSWAVHDGKLHAAAGLYYNGEDYAACQINIWVECHVVDDQVGGPRVVDIDVPEEIVANGDIAECVFRVTDDDLGRATAPAALPQRRV